jgi:hypothetical protein
MRRYKLRTPPAILFHSIPAPPVVWRAATGFFHDAERTAADVICYEQAARGHALDLSPAHVRELEDYEAQALLWVTFTREDALRYARAEDVTELRLDIPAYVIAKDDQGGFLLFFPDDLTQPTGGAAMAESYKDPAAEIPDEVAAARGAKRERLAGEIAEHQYAAAVLIGVDDDQSFLQFVHAEAKAAKLTELGGGVPPHLPQPEDEDEQKRRAGRGGGGDMGNPADANLGANIRPEVGSGPGGLETYTTQKSADYRANPEAVDASDFLRGLLAEAERNANPSKQQEAAAPVLTLEAIAADPQNAVDMPLPLDPSRELLAAAKSAAQYIADGEHGMIMQARPRASRSAENWTAEIYVGDIPEGCGINNVNRLDALHRYDDVSGRLDAINAQRGDERFHFVDAGNAEDRRAILPPQEAVEAFAAHWDYDVVPGPDHDLPAAGKDKLIIIAEDFDYIASGNTYVELADALAERGGLARAAYEDARNEPAPDAATQQENDASTKRQDAERAARSGESAPGASPSSDSGFISNLLNEAKAAKAERETEGAELVTQDHGEGKTPGGGGRGMF